jgi:uncharacterized protein (DUF433 family)
LFYYELASLLQYCDILKSRQIDRHLTAEGHAMPHNPIDWAKCKDVERDPARVSGAWVIKGTRVQADAIVENAMAGCTAEEIAGPEIFPSIPLAVVQRVLRFAKLTLPSNG